MVAVRAVAGFGAVVNVRAVPTFVTVLLVVVVFFVTVDETPAKNCDYENDYLIFFLKSRARDAYAFIPEKKTRS